MFLTIGFILGIVTTLTIQHKLKSAFGWLIRWR